MTHMETIQREHGPRVMGISLEGISEETALQRWELDPVLRREFFDDKAVFSAYLRNRHTFKGIKSENIITK